MLFEIDRTCACSNDCSYEENQRRKYATLLELFSETILPKIHEVEFFC